jgi:hypothetical protein
VSGVASLFSKEFYHHSKRYLKPGGQLVQWLQTYEFDNVLLLHIIKALDENFAHVSVYRAPEEPDIILVASDSPVRQEHIDRFRTDPALVEEFETIHRPWHFFGEQNFLFNARSLKPLFQHIAANSEFVPHVDNKAERARFINTYADMISAFDSCQVCWPLVLDSQDYAPRLAFRLQLEESFPRDFYLENHLNASLDRDSVLDWGRFWIDYRKWSARVPFSTIRNSIPLYARLQTKAQEKLLASAQDSLPLEDQIRNEGQGMPFAVALEFGFLDLAAQGKYKEAAAMLPLFREIYHLEGMDELFLRHLFLIGILGGQKDEMRHIYLESIRKSPYFDSAERRLMAITANVPLRVRKK